MPMQEIHQQQPVKTAGASLQEARAAMVMVHGRGATARDILTLTQELNRPQFAYLAPQAANNTWYPYSFLAPIEQNQPYLDSALATVGGLLAHLEENGFPPQRIVMLGFSQGACLLSEYAARNAQRYGAVVALSGGLIGPPGTPRNYDGSFDGTPVFFGCSDVDPHIPVERVEESASVLQGMDADVTTRLYPGMGHLVNEDEIQFVQQLMDQLLESTNKN
jgi:predicted esterase